MMLGLECNARSFEVLKLEHEPHRIEQFFDNVVFAKVGLGLVYGFWLLI